MNANSSTPQQFHNQTFATKSVSDIYHYCANHEEYPGFPGLRRVRLRPITINSQDFKYFCNGRALQRNSEVS